MLTIQVWFDEQDSEKISLLGMPCNIVGISYRCYRDGSGLYWVAYFKCEEGTVFSDSLDQCVFESANEKCLPIGQSSLYIHLFNMRFDLHLFYPSYRFRVLH